MIGTLAEQIAYHDNLYWNLNAPEISDAEYDVLVEQLRSLDPDHPVLHRVHGGVGGTKHPEPMLSLSKAYTREEVVKWARSVARSDAEVFGVTTKWDGVSARLVVSGGRPQALYSRGDGYEGEDWTRHLKHVQFPFGMPDRGEIIVRRIDFSRKREEVAALLGREYKNTRAMAGGLLNNASLPDDLPSVLTFLPFTLGVELVTLRELIEEVDFGGCLADLADNDFPADGLVIRLVDNEYAESLGNTEHHPRHSIALKIKNPAAETVLLGVEWQVAASRLAPVALLEPCELDGVTISRATLHNLQQIARLDLTLGATVRVERAGSVIPAVTGLIKAGSSPIGPPESCPSCGAPVRTDGQDVWCSAPETCPSTQAGRLLNGLRDLGVESVGPTTAQALVAAGYSTLPAVFAMTKGDWLKLPGFAEKSAAQMVKQFTTAKLTPIEDFKIIAAMGIPGIGQTLAKQFCNVRPAGSYGETSDVIENFGPERQRALQSGFDYGLWAWAPSNLNLINTYGAQDKPLICFTGEGPQSRDALIKLAESRGFVFHKSVTKSLALLVCTDPEGSSNKLKKARQYGTKIQSYEEWI